jgi:hypothetical protein
MTVPREPSPTTEPAADAPAADAPTTTPTQPPRLPPDPEAYDSVRAQHARARGLAAPYIAGGRDPDPATGRREERFYVRLLVIMVLALVFGGFVIGFLIALLQSGGA